MKTVPSCLAKFPKKRCALTPEYAEIYEDEYKINRGKEVFATKLSASLEGWMHRKIAKRQGTKTLEIGAGTLNHLRFEPKTHIYDIVEPFNVLFHDKNLELRKVGSVYADISDIPKDELYERIISIAVFEHLEDLPFIVAMAALHLSTGGILQTAYPSEGGALWGMAWRLSTGISFRLRRGLSYKPFRVFEHVNSGIEILDVINYFFKKTKTERYPTRFHNLSLYTYTLAEDPVIERCLEYVAYSMSSR